LAADHAAEAAAAKATADHYAALAAVSRKAWVDAQKELTDAVTSFTAPLKVVPAGNAATRK